VIEIDSTVVETSRLAHQHHLYYSVPPFIVAALKLECVRQNENIEMDSVYVCHKMPLYLIELLS
jgi:hypothetical protein